MARESNLSLKDFWQEIINACYLDQENPIKTWESTFIQINDLKKKLNDLPVDTYHMISEKTDLYIKLGEKRIWQGGRGSQYSHLLRSLLHLIGGESMEKYFLTFHFTGMEILLKIFNWNLKRGL